ncbi:histone methylation protein DOT1-domain-containing protein, partial [Vararia minispora EC-137]
LAAPRDPDDFNPVRDMEETLYTIVEHYMTPAQAAPFGPIPGRLPIDADADAPSSSAPALLRLFKRALARRDGPAFRAVLAQINDALCALKYPPPPATSSTPPPSSSPPHSSLPPNALVHNIARWMPSGPPQPVVLRILEEAYQRVVRPQERKLENYKAFHDTVYGELLPPLVARILRTHTRLRPGQIFVDLGSGVGQVCAQAALQTGCTAYGIEIQPDAASVAASFVRDVRARAQGGWALRMGECEVVEGDILVRSEVAGWVREADVVLVNNKVFSAQLNEHLRTLFLDLKDGALVVSLAPFRHASGDRALEDVASIFDVETWEFYGGEVSWTGTGGEYYVHRVDRAAHRARVARLEAAERRTRGARR